MGAAPGTRMANWCRAQERCYTLNVNEGVFDGVRLEAARRNQSWWSKSPNLGQTPVCNLALGGSDWVGGVRNVADAMLKRAENASIAVRVESPPSGPSRTLLQSRQRVADHVWADGPRSIVDRLAPWRQKPSHTESPTLKQLAFAQRLGIGVPPGTSAGDVGAMIDARMAEMGLPRSAAETSASTSTVFHCTFSVGKSMYRLNWTEDRYREVLRVQLASPVKVLIDEPSGRTYWYFRDRFFWENDDLSWEQVHILLLDRERQLVRRIDRATARATLESDLKQPVAKSAPVDTPRQESPGQRLVSPPDRPGFGYFDTACTGSGKQEPIPMEVKHLVYRRDENSCVVCGSSEGLDFIYIIPVAKGGTDTPENVRLLCPIHTREGTMRDTDRNLTDRRRPIPKDVQIFVHRRDQGKCVVCGSKERLEFDHIIPFVMGGSNTARNIQLLCEFHNREKGGNLA